MAIPFEAEEKRGVSVFGFLIVLVIAGTLFAGVYFLFFERPDLVQVVLPRGLEDVEDISTVELQPEAIFASEKFQALRRYSQDIVLPQPGKRNPFLP